MEESAQSFSRKPENDCKWAVLVPLAAGNGNHELCVCDCADSAAAIVRALCACAKNPPAQIILEARYS